MNSSHGRRSHIGTSVAVAVCALVLVACASQPPVPDGADTARAALTQLQSDPNLATRAPAAMKEAEAAVSAAEQPQRDEQLGEHLVQIAQRKVAIAQAKAQTQYMESRRQDLAAQRNAMLLNSRTREADAAHQKALSADARADQLQKDAMELQKKVDALTARQTDRGLVITLGDLLFKSGKADLGPGAAANVAKLAAFLNKYPNHTVVIAGHTDSTGSAAFNMALSKERAEAVKNNLIANGVAADRLQAVGKGESAPIAENTTSSGRQKNRRVEVIISNSVANN